MIDNDASKYALDSVLLQQKDDEYPKAWDTAGYWSKTLANEERNYSTTDRECFKHSEKLSVVWALKSIRPYV